MRFLVPRAAAFALLVSPLVSCSGGSSPTPPPNTGTSPFLVTITRQNGAQSFSPNPASAGGRMVAFRNADSVAHSVRLNDGSVDTGIILPGATSAAVAMPGGGTNYHCSLHPDMIGAVNTESGAPPPACEGPYCVD